MSGALENLMEALMKNKEELLIKFLQILEGKEAKGEVDLGGVSFKVGEANVELSGKINFSVRPSGKKK